MTAKCSSWVFEARLSADGSSILTVSRRHPRGLYPRGAAPDDDIARIWDAQTGQCRFEFTGHNKQIGIVELASGDGSAVYAACENHTLKIWDASTGLLQLTLTGHTEDITSVASTSSGDTRTPSWHSTASVDTPLLHK